MKGEFLPFTLRLPVFIGIPGEKMKGEGQNHIPLLYFLRYKDFSKIPPPIFYRNTATNISYNKEAREQNAKQLSCFAKIVKCLRKGTIAPRQGHLCARVRAQLCPRKAQGCTSQTPPVNPKHRFLSIRDTSCKQVICT